jgi:Fe-S oxidoreductase
MNALHAEIEAGTPVIVLEPSCASVFRDELHGLFPTDPLANKLKDQTFLLSEFLERKGEDWQAPRFPRKALVQGHCHHKSLLGFENEDAVLKKLGLDYKVLASGCCGMAGSFGFENDKYDVSVDIGERVLLPAVREAAAHTLIVADGFSCREQIAQESSREGLHLAEIIHLAQTDGHLQDGEYAETRIVQSRKSSRRKARLWAGLALAGIAGAGVLLSRAMRHH